MDNNFLKVLSCINANQTFLRMSLINSSSIIKFCESNDFSYTQELVPIDFNRPAAWYKIEMILKELENKNYKYILWIDTDALIHNYNFDLKSIFKNGKQLYMSKDHNGINSGVIVIKNTKLMYNFFKKIQSMTDFIHEVNWDNSAIVNAINTNYLNIKSKLEIVPQKILNSYLYNLYNDVPIKKQKGNFSKNDSFIVHFPGFSPELKLHFMQNFIKIYNICLTHPSAPDNRLTLDTDLQGLMLGLVTK
jgi:hypothetical protein